MVERSRSEKAGFSSAFRGVDTSEIGPAKVTRRQYLELITDVNRGSNKLKRERVSSVGVGELSRGSR